MDTAPLSPVPQIPLPKRSKKWWVVIGIILALLIVGLLAFPQIAARVGLDAFRSGISVAHPELAIVPVPLDLSSVYATGPQSFSYYGVSFKVPWQDVPKVVTSTGDVGTQLKFSGGQFVTVMTRSSFTDSVSAVLASTLMDAEQIARIKSVFGENTFASDYNFLKVVLGASPSDTGVANTTLLPLKYSDFGLLGEDKPLAIYNFEQPIKGFEMVGQGTKNGQIHRITFLFDADGKGAHDFIIGGATDDEANSVLASIQLK